MKTIKVTDEVHKAIVEIQGSLMREEGKRCSADEALRVVIEAHQKK